MKNLKRILVAMDLSGADYRLLDFVKWLAMVRPGLKVDFLHVMQPVSIPALAGMMSDAAFSSPDLENQFKIEMEEEAFAKLEDLQVELHFEVAEGNITKELVEYVSTAAIDLTLVGQKEHSMGSGVAVRRFLRNSPAPVLFVPEHAGTNIDHLLVPVDFSECSARAVETAIELASRLPSETEITLLHVFDVPTASHFQHNDRYASTVAQYKRKVENYFPLFLKRIDAKGMRFHTAIIDNAYFNTARNIASYAHEHMAGLVVMGAKGHSTASSFLLGGVTEKFLAYNENIPVLIVK